MKFCDFHEKCSRHFMWATILCVKGPPSSSHKRSLTAPKLRNIQPAIFAREDLTSDAVFSPDFNWRSYRAILGSRGRQKMATMLCLAVIHFAIIFTSLQALSSLIEMTLFKNMNGMVGSTRDAGSIIKVWGHMA